MNFELKNSDGFKIKLSKEQINQLSTMEKISKAIKDEDVIAFDIYQENNLVGFVETDIVNENNVHEVNMRLNLIDDVEN